MPGLGAAAAALQSIRSSAVSPGCWFMPGQKVWKGPWLEGQGVHLEASFSCCFLKRAVIPVSLRAGGSAQCDWFDNLEYYNNQLDLRAFSLFFLISSPALISAVGREKLF